MDEESRHNSDSEQAVKCFTELSADEIVQSPFSCCTLLRTQLTENFSGETGEGFQPSNESCRLGSQDCNQGILKEAEEPAIKKFRRPAQDKQIDEKGEERFISALPGDNENWLLQRVRCRPQSPVYGLFDPDYAQFQASSTEHEQVFWSQEFALRADWISISGVRGGRRRHAICEELDTTVGLLRSGSEESFNLRNISHELDNLTDSRKRKR